MTASAKHRERALPSDDVLFARLRAALAESDVMSEPRAIVTRTANPRQGTFASELVTVALDGDRTLDLFCKHGDVVARSNLEFRGGLPGGLAYEARVHRLALGEFVTPALIGLGQSPSADPSATLAFRRMVDAVAVSDVVPKRDGLGFAAEWIGAFHRSATGIVGASALNRWTEDFYLRWPDRAAAFAPAAEVVLDRARLRDVFVDRIGRLVADETLVHGDYYSDQVFVSEGSVDVVDWELAAIGCGEVDLATLTLGRSAEATALIEDAYVRARWPDGVDDGHAARLFLARIFLLLRLVGVAPDWPDPRRFRRRARLLQQLLEGDEPQATPTS
jgi:hypothetical protein